MKYILSESEQQATALTHVLVAAGINVAIIVAVNGFGTMVNAAFSSVAPLVDSVCTRFC
jgi:Flp pilus assembly pilin Flp